MTRATTEQIKHAPWFAKAGAACSIVPIARLVNPNVFALKGGGYGCLFSLTVIDDLGLTDLELDSRMRSIERSYADCRKALVSLSTRASCPASIFRARRSMQIRSPKSSHPTGSTS